MDTAGLLRSREQSFEEGKVAAGHAIAPGIKDDGHDDYYSGDDPFGRFRRAYLSEAGFEGRNDQHAEEGEQARSMIEQGQQLLQQGSDGLKQIAGAKIAVKKQLDDLDAYVKGAANA